MNAETCKEIFGCDGAKTGICGLALLLKNQYLFNREITPENRDRIQDAWKGLRERYRTQVLPVCAHPEQLIETLNSLPEEI